MSMIKRGCTCAEEIELTCNARANEHHVRLEVFKSEQNDDNGAHMNESWKHLSNVQVLKHNAVMFALIKLCLKIQI